MILVIHIYIYIYMFPFFLPFSLALARARHVTVVLPFSVHVLVGKPRSHRVLFSSVSFYRIEGPMNSRNIPKRS